MTNQEKYDDLDNLISGIDSLASETKIEKYIEELKYLKFEAQKDQEEVEEKLQEEYDQEERERNEEFERSRL